MTACTQEGGQEAREWIQAELLLLSNIDNIAEWENHYARIRIAIYSNGFDMKDFYATYTPRGWTPEPSEVGPRNMEGLTTNHTPSVDYHHSFPMSNADLHPLSTICRSITRRHSFSGDQDNTNNPEFPKEYNFSFYPFQAQIS